MPLPEPVTAVKAIVPEVDWMVALELEMVAGGVMLILPEVIKLDKEKIAWLPEVTLKLFKAVDPMSPEKVTVPVPVPIDRS